MKKFNKKISIVMLALLFATATAGCDILITENNDVYTGPPTVAFKIPEPLGVLNPVSADTTASYKIQLIRSQEGVLEQPLPVGYTVVDSMTTAPPSSYNFKTPSPVVIPAGSLVSDIVISFDTSVIPSGTAAQFAVYLTGNEERGVQGSRTIGILELVIVGSGTP